MIKFGELLSHSLTIICSQNTHKFVHVCVCVCVCVFRCDFPLCRHPVIIRNDDDDDDDYDDDHY